MRGWLPFHTTLRAMLIIFAVFVVFHVFVIAGMVPGEIVWGGRADGRLLQFELVSISLLLIFAAVVALRGRVRQKTPWLLTTIALWIMALLFALNTVGNLLAETTTETLLFTPVTLLLTLGAFRLAIEPRPNTSKA